jgi:hypothetical protein
VCSRPQASLPNASRKNLLSNDISLPNSAHKSVSLLYQFLVLTMTYLHKKNQHIRSQRLVALL